MNLDQQIIQIRRLLEKANDIRMNGMIFNDKYTISAGLDKILGCVDAALELLPCPTCNGSKKVPTAQSIGFGKANVIWESCPDCQGIEKKAIQYVSKCDVTRLLMKWSSLKGKEEIAHIKPGHGPCCTCQECGYHHDDCVCRHNKLLIELNSLSTIEK